MNRINLFIAAVLWACPHAISVAAETSSVKPNVLFIFADDWGWGDLSCHGHPYVRTPNIDKLAREGTDFHRFTVASGVCSPSRTAVMTGHFPARYNIDGHFAWVPSNAKRNMPDWLDTSVVTIPRLMQSAGYATAHFGKWHLSNDMIPDSPSPARYGYDTYGAFNCSGEQMPVHEDAANAISFIEKSHQAGQPFFINLWIHEPHTPFHVIPKYRWQFRDSGLEQADEIYASVLSHADDRIGEVLDALDRLGLTDNTLVIFSSDNGPARAAKPTPCELSYDTATGAGFGVGASKGVTAGRKGHKAALFEGGINVPFIARWPGKIAANGVNKKLMISAVDLLPTFCDVAGVELPQGYQADGVSLVAELQGKESFGRDKPLFWKMASRWPAAKTQPYHWVSYCVVHQNWKLVANHDGSYVELYDIVADSYEKTDLKQTHPEVVVQLTKELSEWKSTLPAKPNAKNFSTLRNNMK
ncbi:Arylsulfatase [Planctomycetes bacterium CA13]|uniref:Arylsulfatase n=1 Tax=Novipirellula herctigrandis TaxID=2527986 RepID=A0A5C5Z0C0_9BACT|nr:Arylsulfatase [Planctomycetes bacterium CA13]